MLLADAELCHKITLQSERNSVSQKWTDVLGLMGYGSMRHSFINFTLGNRRLLIGVLNLNSIISKPMQPFFIKDGNNVLLRSQFTQSKSDDNKMNKHEALTKYTIVSASLITYY